MMTIASGSPNLAGGGSRRSVFLADPDPAVGDALVDVLSPLDVDLVSFDNGGLLLTRLPAVEPICVIAEIDLPDVPGLSLLQRIRTDHPAVPVVLISRDSDVSSAVLAMRAGALDYLEKSCMHGAVLRHVSRILRAY